MTKVRGLTILAKSIPFRKEFNLAKKESKESPDEWLARVETLAEMCSFGRFQNLCVLDKFLTGLDAEIIDHLCKTAEYLDIATALEIIDAYSKRKNCSATEEVPTKHDQIIEPVNLEAGELVDHVRPAMSEFLLVKCEDITNDDENGGDHEFSNDNIFDDGTAAADNYTSSENDNDKDSDFNPSDYDSKAKKEAKRVKRKYVKKVKKENSDETEPAAKPEPVDPNAPKKKRNYKKRATKPKEIFECDYCHYKVMHKCHLIRHMYIHLDRKSFICHECGKGFNMLLNLQQHLRRHAGYKPHTCEVCKASFIDKSRLRLHMRTHTGERPFACTMCDKRFSDKHYLMKIHMRLHTGERPFKCDQCSRTFSQSSSLSLHKRKSCMFQNYDYSMKLESQ